MRVDRSGALLRTLLLGLFLLQLSAFRMVYAQETTTPQLHDRSAANGAPDAAPAPDASGDGESVLPPDASGTYHFEHDNESIELDINPNARKGHAALSGYISRLGDAETDRDTPLTFFFDKSSIEGSQLAFQTRVLHGVWYSFHGTVVRGSSQGRELDGYYVLHGTLLEHHPASGQDKSADETIERRIVNFKSMGR